MPIRGLLIDLDALDGSTDVSALCAELPEVMVGVLAETPVPVPGAAFTIPVTAIGLPAADPRILAMAAAAAHCHLRELVLVSLADGPLAATAEATGVRLVAAEGSAGANGIADEVERLQRAELATAGQVGVGPHAQPWPGDPRLDPLLLEHGDRRNVVDGYRYWAEAAIVADLDARRQPVHVAVENWQHDLNIGTVVRNANAFNVAGVHIVGKRRWNRRGAMATDRYLSVTHHESVESFASWAGEEGLVVVGIDNVPGARALETEPLPAEAVLVFGQEGPGLSEAMVEACAMVCEISQQGSTRSLNAGVASGIALYAWTQQHGSRLAP